MAKPEWGAKRICQSCGARFYDFHRSPITCPACGAGFDLESVGRSRRPRPVPRAVAPVGGLAAVAGVLDEDLPLEGVVVDEAEEVEEVEEKAAEETEEGEVEEEDEESLIEDASELGEDEDDVGEVIDSVDDEDEVR